MKTFFTKKFKLIIGIIIISFTSLAQSPESMNYQAVIRNSSGTLIANQSVGIRIKILQGSANGSAVYNETFNPTTNAYGMVSLQIGTGSVVSGTFSSIDWGNNSYYVETAADVSGGSNYSVVSTTQFMSVPYALYAKSAGSSPADNDWSESGNNIYRNSGNVGIGTTNPTSKLQVDGVIKGSHIEINGNQVKSTVSDLHIQLDGGYNTTLNSQTGKVGIGTLTPTSKLDVNGDINLTGNLKINGVAQTFGSSNTTITSDQGFYSNTTNTNAGTNSVSIGPYAGQTSQGPQTVAVGSGAGSNNQDFESVAIGWNAGNSNQSNKAVTIGALSGKTSQGQYAVAVGYKAGETNQGPQSVSIGLHAGKSGQGSTAIAIGRSAGELNQHNNTTIINASGNTLNSINSSAFYVKPIRQANGSRLLNYDPNSGEISYFGDGSSGQVLQTDGSGILSWSSPASGVSQLNGLSDVLVDGVSNSSIWIGTIPPNIRTWQSSYGINDGANWNTAVGQSALYKVVNGVDNSAVGHRALYELTTGYRNTSMGGYSMKNNTTGSKNTSIGFYAGFGNTTGEDNTSLGLFAGDLISSGSKNLVLGSGADPSTNNAINQIVIGYGSTGQADNSVTLGNSDVTKVYMAEDGEATVYAGGLNVGGNYSLPSSDGNANQVLQTNGSGTLSWSSISGSASQLNDLSDVVFDSGNLTNSLVIGSNLSPSSNSTHNVFIGKGAGSNLNNSIQNVAIGYNANANASGAYNVHVGYLAGSNGGGYNQVGIGKAALQNSTGSDNTAVGRNSLSQVNSGSRNTAIGHQSGNNITTGSNNLLIGMNVYSSAANSVNQTVIGTLATGQADNSVTLGNSDVTAVYMSEDAGATIYAGGMDLKTNSNSEGSIVSLANSDDSHRLRLFSGHSADPNPFMSWETGDPLRFATSGGSGSWQEHMRIQNGNVGIGTTNPSQKLHVEGNVYAHNFWTPSDLRFKEDFIEIENALENVLKLSAKYYYYKTSLDFKDRGFPTSKQIGFIAQDLMKIYPEIVTEGKDGYLKVDYPKLTPILVEAIKEQNSEIKSLKKELNEIKSILNLETE